MTDQVSDSRFNMWRAVIAMIHADDVVKPHEVNFVLQNIRQLAFSDGQMDILTHDLERKADLENLFDQITALKDREDFFSLARAISWSDGEFDERERAAIAAMSQRLLAGTSKAKGVDLSTGVSQGEERLSFRSLLSRMLRRPVET